MKYWIEHDNHCCCSMHANTSIFHIRVNEYANFHIIHNSIHVHLIYCSAHIGQVCLIKRRPQFIVMSIQPAHTHRIHLCTIFLSLKRERKKEVTFFCRLNYNMPNFLLLLSLLWCWVLVIRNNEHITAY